ncbi:phage/plasmid primase, P4 family [Spirillospora sp. NPDC048911]|uniref:phage/plasmid primase, P4 family n=1 Tax=Spirillospora sp. NPDC048911 TaxID=3364527 RepID=UPI003710C5D3
MSDNSGPDGVLDDQPSSLDAALALHAAGLCVVRAATDGSKAPLGTWKTHQNQRPGEQDIRTWFGSGHPGVGVVTGAVSGGLEMLELEGRAVTAGLLRELREAADASGLGPLFARLISGYAEMTPSGGLHLLYRVAGTAKPSVRLARDAASAVLIETRGEGGFVVVAPSHGPVHPTGRPWALLRGGPDTIPVITEPERDAFHQLAATFDRTPRPAAAGPGAGRPAGAPGSGAVHPIAAAGAMRPERGGGGVSPGDAFNEIATWDEILQPHGWTKVHTRGTETFWRRPDKTFGISATTGYGDGDWLYVFSTSTPFEPERTYTKFAAHTMLEHGGDYSRAARFLSGRGLGQPAPEQPRPVPHAVLSVVGEPQTYSLSDDGNALRLVDANTSTLRYVPQRGQWLTFEGHRWRWDHAEHVRELARTIARGLPDGERAEQRHRRRSLSANGIAAMVRLAQSDPRVVVDLGSLDARPFELNTPAGTIDLRTGTLRAADPAGLHTRSTSVAPVDAEPRRWLEFLATTFAGDPELTTFVHRLLGLSLVGRVMEQVLPFCHGAGANGKTTLLSVVQRVIGIGDTGYSISAPAELLLSTTMAGHPTEIARLAGARLVVTSELDEGQRFGEAKVKLLTGGDTLSGRFMRQDFFSFTPSHTLWLLANHQPQVRVGGPAFWRRLKLLPFLHVVPPEERDAGLEDRLVEDEGPAILNWLIQGAAGYFAEGLPEPTSVQSATHAYASDQDSIARFVEERCETGEHTGQHMRVRVAELRAAYETFCRQEGEAPASAKALTLALRSRYGVASERSPSARYYVGVRLTDAVDAGSGPEALGWAS